MKTSPKVRKLQRVLYRKAKAEPHWRFYSLYGELYRQDLLLEVRTRNQAAVVVVRKINQITRGWANAFHYGHSTRVFGKQQTFVRNRLRRWLWRKFSRTHGLFEFFTDERLEGQYKLWRWPLNAAWTK